MTTTKLAINLSEGTVQVEGNEDFVRFIYQDFKEHLSQRVVLRSAVPVIEHAAGLPPKLIGDESSATSKQRRSRKSTSSENGKARTGDYKPQFNAQLNLSGLEAAYDEWKPENNYDKILLFAVYLRDELNVSPCTADDIYTCFSTLNRKGKTKVPTAFVQSFRDTQNRTHFIECRSLQEIHVTIPGDNHFNEKKQKNNQEAHK